MTPPVPTPAELPATSDGAALLAAIVAHPDEDTPRLMYADWLDENGEGARAEFIRVQCELAKHGPPRRKVAANTCVINRGIISFTTNGLNAGTGSLGLEAGERIDLDVSESGVRARSGAGTKKLIHGVMVERREGTFFEGRLDTESVEDPTTPLHARESALLSANRRTWLAGGVCEKCPKFMKVRAGEAAVQAVINWGNAKKNCPACFGSGDSGGLLRPGCEVTFVRGWPYRVTVPQMAWLVEEVEETCPDCLHWRGRVPADCRCGGTRRVTRPVPSAWFRSALGCSDNPLTPTIAERGLIAEIVPADKVPAHSPRYGYGWVDNPFVEQSAPAVLPWYIFRPLKGFTANHSGQDYDWKYYRTAATAVSALGRAVCDWGRD